MIKKISVIVGTIVGAISIIAGLYTLDERWAKADELQTVAMRLDQKILQDRVWYIQERIWKLQDRFCKDGQQPPYGVVDEIRRLKAEKKSLENQLEGQRK